MVFLKNVVGILSLISRWNEMTGKYFYVLNETKIFYFFPKKSRPLQQNQYSIFKDYVVRTFCALHLLDIQIFFDH